MGESLKLSLRSVSKTFHHSHREPTSALENVSFDIRAGEFVCLLGPSGCGKTTLLNIIGGLDKPDSGTVLMDGEEIKGPGRDRVVIFQEPALFPWLNVQDNVAFGLDCIGIPKKTQTPKIAEFLRMVGLSSFRKAYMHEAARGAGSGPGDRTGYSIDGRAVCGAGCPDEGYVACGIAGNMV
jgi:NitT/TauT family transport system ATP-binding protein